jgi:hypothetical protein
MTKKRAPKKPDSTMPLLDGWRARVRAALEGYGRKAALAAHLSATYGRPPRSWQKSIQDVLTRQSPNGELLLAIDAWLTANP